MTSGYTPQEVLDKILSSCIELTGADSGSIMLLDDSEKYLEIVSYSGFSTKEATGMRLGLGEGITGWVARHGKPRLVNDTTAETDYISLAENLLSELAVPLTVKDNLIGVISLDSRKKNAFVRSHQDFLLIMANLSAGIFVNLKDNHLLRLRNRFHKVLHEISRIISKSLELDEVFLDIMNVTEKAFKLYRSTLLLYDKESDVLRISVSAESAINENREIVYSPGEGITGSVFINRKPVYIPDVSREPTFLNRMKTYSPSGDDVGFFCCPIFSGTEVAGVFSTFTRRQDEFHSDSLLEFLEIIGSVISQAITIQNLVREEKKVMELENIHLRHELSEKYQFDNITGRSGPMIKLFEKIRLVADSRSSVLITGESGTGKELIVSAIHYNSPRRESPLIKINCAAIPENLLESELFGHKKGAFTGAIADKKGKFELAEGGTIFLDEIGEMDFNLQSKLLRVIQEREIEPVGGRTKKIDVRVVAATNADLEGMIAEKKFRADLFYRLNVVTLHIPPLRDRKDDIHLLVMNFIEKYKSESGKTINGITPEAIRYLEKHDWPGNVRQLENSVERAIVLSRNQLLDVEDFYDEIRSSDVVPAERMAAAVPDGMHLPQLSSLDGLEGRAYEAVISEVERKLIHAVLKKFKYTKVQAAKFLGINRNTLDKKIKELNIDY
ncbi:MAG: sigma 54-interacting transcriptional regulator [Spirochaetia bacterium]|nr:sigma 54-interacting transcriptional regulator [Spirochaetia bacterium]